MSRPARDGRASSAFPTVNQFRMASSCGRVGRLTGQNGGLLPGRPVPDLRPAALAHGDAELGAAHPPRLLRRLRLAVQPQPAQPVPAQTRPDPT
jgi:hypothetical protein